MKSYKIIQIIGMIFFLACLFIPMFLALAGKDYIYLIPLSLLGVLIIVLGVLIEERNSYKSGSAKK